ncbi:MAG TPA: hypothetical protein VIN04_05870 [Myxococcota bacterium]
MQRVVCEGAPRDLGLDQGRGCREAVRAEARALGWPLDGGWLGALRAARGAPRPSRALARDLARHFPHLDERLSGLAAGAGLPREALLVLLEEQLDDAPVHGVGLARDAHGAPRVVVLHATPPPTGLLLRTARPDGGYPNLALTRPGLVAALAGVNERGLAGAVELLDAPAPQRAGAGGCAAASALLLDQCLERLDTVEKALEWCERRPGGGHARIVFADAGGAVGALELQDDARRRCAPRTVTADEAARAVLHLDPAARALEWRAPDGAVEREALEAGG